MKNWEVEAILKFYKDIDLDIKVTGEWLEQYESVYDTTGAINYDGMPHGSNTSDSTALLAIKIAGTDTAERIKELKGRIQELKKLRTEISKEIYSLTPIHKAIICGFYLQGQKWERIAEQISYSVRQSKNIRCVALEVLGGKLARKGHCKNRTGKQGKRRRNDRKGTDSRPGHSYRRFKDCKTTANRGM